MFEFVAFSDIHFHEFKAYSKLEESPWATLYNSRLLDASSAMAQVINYAYVNNIRTVLFGGDLFHTKQNYSKAEVEVVVNTLNIAKFFDINIYLLVGNHDQADREGSIHGLSCVQELDGVTILNGSGHLNIRDEAILHYCSYTADKQTLLANLRRPYSRMSFPFSTSYNCSIFIGHMGVQGARVGSDFVLVGESDIAVTDLPLDYVDVCLLGHFHQHQKLAPNAWYIGATHQQTWGDAGGLRGFVHGKVDDDRNVSIEHIPISGIPRFINLKKEDSIKDVTSRDFVRFYTDEEITPNYINKIMGYFEATSTVPASLEVLPLPTEATKDGDKSSLKQEDLSVDSLIDEWVEEEAQDNKEDLIKTGKELLVEARNKYL